MLTGCLPGNSGSETPTASQPSLTPEPLAIQVNALGITQAEFEAEIARYQAAQAGLGATVTVEQATQAVLDEFIDQLLLVQGAHASGFVLTEADLQTRLDGLAADLGGEAALAAWLSDHGYDPDSFKTALNRAVTAGWMRDQIIAAVPASAEQVHVRQILTYNPEEAQSILASLAAGSDFPTLAAQYDPLTQGDLGWFPRGYLSDTELETAAFALQPDQYSEVIESSIGYHILLLIERQDDRLLAPDALLALQQNAVEEWLRIAQEQSTITLAP